jgi:phage terminase large subunit
MSLSIKSVVGGGYDEFWNFKGRYRLVKGGRGSKKSTTTALWYIFNMMYYYYKFGLLPNVLVIRAVKVDHADTTFAQLKWAINRLGVSALWGESKLPMELRFKPSGQRIIFRGMDKAERIKSITTAVGELCWVWWEEAFEIPFYNDIQTVNMSIRGVLPEGLFYQHTFTFNPNVADHWLKREFYDKVDEHGYSPDGEIFAITRNFDCNEFLDDSFYREMDRIKQADPDRFRIIGLGEWGMSGGLIYTNWTAHQPLIGQLSSDWKMCYGIDFGFTESPTAIVSAAVNRVRRQIVIINVTYLYGKIASEIAAELVKLGIQYAHILADNSHQMAIEEMRRYGIPHITPVRKGNGSIIVGITRIKEYQIIVPFNIDSKFVDELANYRWASGEREDSYSDEPAPNQFDHGLDALRYALSEEPLFDSKYAAQLAHFYVKRRKHPDD